MTGLEFRRSNSLTIEGLSTLNHAKIVFPLSNSIKNHALETFKPVVLLLFGTTGQSYNVPHFSSRSYVRFPVKVDESLRFRQ